MLQVDHESVALRHMCATLESAGYRVVPAADGKEAHELAASASGARIDAVVTDVVMPRLGGIELAAQLHAERPELPILFVSGNVDPRGAGSALPAGSVLLSKPFTGHELRRAVRDLLDRSAERVAPDPISPG